MSTYYYFACTGCKKIGGFLSRDMGGWGGFNIIESFKFIAYHIARCGEECISVVSEHSDCFNSGVYTRPSNSEEKEKFVKETIDIFPSSNDWNVVQNPDDKIDKIWANSYIDKQNRV